MFSHRTDKNTYKTVSIRYKTRVHILKIICKCGKLSKICYLLQQKVYAARSGKCDLGELINGITRLKCFRE